MKKIISYIMVFTMLLTLIPSTLFAADYDYTIAFDNVDYTPTPGEEVELKLYVTNNIEGQTQSTPAMCQIRLKNIEGLTPTVIDGAVSPTVGPKLIDYLSYNPVTFSDDTALFTIKYTIPETAAVGTTYSVEFDLNNTYLINDSMQVISSVETKNATITVTEPTPLPAKLTLIDGNKRIPYPATGIKPEASNWIYNFDGSPLTEMNDGLGGIYIAANKSGRYAKVTKGNNDKRAALFIMSKNASYFADNYFVFTANIYGQTPFTYRVDTTTYEKTFDSSKLKANQWNNFTMIYDVNQTSGKNAYFYINGKSVDYINKGPDVSAGVQMRLTLTDVSSTYYVDDIAIYKASTFPYFAMPTVTEGSKYTVDGNTITYTEAMTVADITSTGTAVRAYASADTAMKTALSKDTVLSADDVVVVEAPVNPDATEYICRYNYYTIDGEPLEPETPTGTQIEGTDIYWYYDEATTTLGFTGTGALPDWSTLSYRPWHSNIAKATKIIIGEGITVIGKNSFRGSYALKEVVFPDSTLTTIGESAFQYTNLTEFVIPDSVTTIGKNAFYYEPGHLGTKLLTSVTIPNPKTTIDSTAFTGQTEVVIKCYDDSTAHKFARTNNFKYFLLDKAYEIGYASTTNTATYRSFTEQATTAIAIIYNRTNKDGVSYINDIHFKEINLDGFGTPVEVVAPEEFSEEVGSVTRIMLWNNWNDITPLCDDEFKQHKN